MNTLLILDTHALLHRAFHALPPFTSPDGKPVGAIYGIASMILKLLREHNPQYVVATGDRPEPTFRKQQFEEYKAHRPPTHPNLVEQLIAARTLFSTFQIPFLEVPGFEADDIIGTLVASFKNKDDLRIVIITGDLDTLQLVENDHILVETPKRGLGETSLYNENAVRERFSLAPSQIPDLKGLIGDASDNIPGIRGVGPKTATKILNTYTTLEQFFSSSDELAQKYAQFRDQALRSKQLATIHCAVPLSTTLNDVIFHAFNEEKIRAYFLSLGFESLIKRLTTKEEKSSHHNQISPQSML